MMYRITFFSFLVLYCSGKNHVKANLRASRTIVANERRRNRRKLTPTECTLVAAIQTNADDNSEDDETPWFECYGLSGNDGIGLPIAASAQQMNQFQHILEDSNSDFVSGEYVLDIPDAETDGDTVFIPPGLDVSVKKREDNPSNNNEASTNDRDRRNLAIVTGDKPILVVRVIDSMGWALAKPAAEVSSDVFGSNTLYTDTFNLKSQMWDCSFGQLNVIPGEQGVGFPGDPNGLFNANAPGTIDINIGIDLKNETEAGTRYIVRNAITSAVQEQLGYNLPGPYQQVMYMLPGCQFDCGWKAYAYINSWNSVYQGPYVDDTRTLMHEIGHNLNLAHSGEGTASYGDHTCSMGNPPNNDEYGRICYNSAKNFQIGWFNDAKVTVDPQNTPEHTFSIHTHADYNNRGALPVTVKLETRTTTDYFVGLNRNIGPNSETTEYQNEVVIIETGKDGTGYSQSWIKSHLPQGQSYTFINWGNTGNDMTITADTIDLVANRATVSISFSTPPTDSPTAAAPVTASPTPSPTSAPPTAPPTPSPTPFPTTATPTSACGNGMCEINLGESCTNCPGDCETESQGAVCGNGVCEAGDGENCVNCAADCNGITGGKPSDRYCCGADQNNNYPVGCNGQCGSSCTTTSVPVGTFCCGNSVCDGSENFWKCPNDCDAPQPTAAPVPTTPAPVSCPVCSVTGEPCCGNCKTNGNVNNQGCQI